MPSQPLTEPNDGKDEAAMSTITNTVEIRAGADEVWAVLADLTATRHWLPGVVAARMDGDLRVCTMADGEQVHERISELAAEHRRLGFEHVRVPLPVRRSAGAFTVTPGSAPGTATVHLETTIEPLDPTAADELAAMVHDAFQQSLDSLRRYVEDKATWDSASSADA
jgi:uncharacterized protein YndB with AHSA1/START domain